MNTPRQPSQSIIYKITVAYDGTDYHGWQEQAIAPSITSVLQDTFEKVFSEQIRIVGSSRTDAGVHAQGQVAIFMADVNVSPAGMLKAWNHRLPPSIHIHSLEIAPEGFHPRRKVLQKTYHYHFITKRPSPMVARHAWFYWYPFDEQKLRDALQLFVGTHDFRNFCSIAENDLRSPIRTINAIELQRLTQTDKLHLFEANDVWRITVHGQSFLHFMIRRIVGAALHIASHQQFDLSIISDGLTNKPGHQAGMLPKAPAHGLLLSKIEYKQG